MTEILSRRRKWNLTKNFKRNFSSPNKQIKAKVRTIHPWFPSLRKNTSLKTSEEIDFVTEWVKSTNYVNQKPRLSIMSARLRKSKWFPKSSKKTSMAKTRLKGKDLWAKLTEKSWKSWESTIKNLKRLKKCVDNIKLLVNKKIKVKWRKKPHLRNIEPKSTKFSLNLKRSTLFTCQPCRPHAKSPVASI